ncbi:MAG: UDP-N-acetylmuramate dehydrogenase [Deltaproteobacteria bacterium]|nr:UDP-N-acetylmuramate dehydrogenase [Deltaproteobacteria bacterium]
MADIAIAQLSEWKGVRGKIAFSEPMSTYTSLKVGGPADLYFAPVDAEDLAEILTLCQKRGIEWLPFGGGCNLLVTGKGIRGAVIHLKHLILSGASGGVLDALRQWELFPGEEIRLRLSAALALPRLLNLALERGWGGVEFLAGIPGTVGGAVAMNAGTRLGEFGDVVESVEILAVEGRFIHLPAEDLFFSYRHCELPAGSAVISAEISLYAHPDPREMRAKTAEYMQYRRESQPLSKPNCGSVFKNPPGYKAGALIEECGLKGQRIGDAQISDLHGNFIVNLGEAKSEDVLALIELAKGVVCRELKIELEEEVRIVGEK